MNRRNLLLGALGTAAAPNLVPAQSAVEPQLTALTLEARIPLANIVGEVENIIGLPPTVLQTIAGGAAELRARFEYQPASRSLRAWLLIAPTQAPFPLPQAPAESDPSVGYLFDFAMDYVTWYRFISRVDDRRRTTVTVAGRRLGILVNDNPLPYQSCVLQFGYDDAYKFRLASFSIAGVVTMASAVVEGTLDTDPGIAF